MLRMRALVQVAVIMLLGGLAFGQTLPADREGALSRFDFRQIVNQAKDKVFPAVVFIKCVAETYEDGKKASQEVSGSGVIISPEGEVLTNWHVVDKAVQVRCLLLDGRPMDAKVVGSDKDSDLALLKLVLPKDSLALPCATIGDSAILKEGDFVMAMGAPWGLSRSVSIGIVSCTRRFLPEHSEYSLWLQTDASISPGNSGGPLVNTAGEVIGINTRGTMQGGDLGFAIPAETIRQIVPQLRQGKMNWSWTGLQLQPIKDFNRNMYFEGTDGVIVADTDPESPARAAGLQPHDRLMRINGESVNALTEEDLPAVRRRLGLLPKAKPAKVELLRGTERLSVDLIPREKGKVEGEELDCPRWDFTVKAINQFDNPDLFFQRKAGVFVHGVKYPGNASAAGLQAQDIVLKIDGKEVTTIEQLKAAHKEALEQVASKSKAVLTVLRNGLMRQVVLDFSRDYSKE